MKVLAAVDGSDASIRTISFISENPWLPGTIVRVVAVADKVHPSIAELVGSGGSVQDSQHALEEHCGEVAASFVAQLRHAGLTAESVILAGSPKPAILEEAERWHADLIVVGMHRRSHLSHMLLGSVALAIATDARCSVLIVRQTEDPSS